jgi:putative membrane protein
LTGLLIGSLWRIWPYQALETVVIRDKPRVIGATPFWPESLEVSVVALGLFGLLIVLAIEFVAGRRASTALV